MKPNPKSFDEIKQLFEEEFERFTNLTNGKNIHLVPLETFLQILPKNRIELTKEQKFNALYVFNTPIVDQIVDNFKNGFKHPIIENYNFISKGQRKAVFDAGDVVIKICPNIQFSIFNDCSLELEKESIYHILFPKTFAKSFFVVVATNDDILYVVIQEKLNDAYTIEGADQPEKESFEDYEEYSRMLELNIDPNLKDTNKKYNPKKNNFIEKNYTDFSFGYNKEGYLVAYDFN
jgi:hypothetical protein